MANEVTSIYYRDLALGKNQQLGGEKVRNTEVNLADGLSKAELEKIDEDTTDKLIQVLKNIAYNNSVLSKVDIGKISTVMAVLSGLDLDEYNIDEVVINDVIETVQKTINIEKQLKNIKKLGLNLSYSDDVLKTILNTGNTNGNNKFDANENYDLGKISLTKSIDNCSINGVNAMI